MRRLGLMLVVLTVAGCNALRDAFSAHAEVAGTAAGQTLTVDRLADLAGHARRVPLRAEVLSGLAGMYLDYAVFATTLARGRDLNDTALVLAAEWPAVSQIRWERFHDRLVASRVKLTRAQTDSAYVAGGVRLFQHILIRVPPNAAPPEQSKKQQEAAGLCARLRHSTVPISPSSRSGTPTIPAPRRGAVICRPPAAASSCRRSTAPRGSSSRAR